MISVKLKKHLTSLPSNSFENKGYSIKELTSDSYITIFLSILFFSIFIFLITSRTLQITSFIPLPLSILFLYIGTNKIRNPFYFFHITNQKIYSCITGHEEISAENIHAIQSTSIQKWKDSSLSSFSCISLELTSTYKLAPDFETHSISVKNNTIFIMDNVLHQTNEETVKSISKILRLERTH